VTVRLTDVTVDAETGTVSCAWSCRGAEFTSTAPRSHEDVPLALPQPKLNPGAPPLAGVACSWIVASGTSPPVVQALTVHCAACPRSVLACALATSTQRLTCVVCDTVLAPICELVLVGVPVGVGVGFALRVRLGAGVTFAVAFAVALGVALGVTLGVALGVTLAEDLTMARVLVGDGVGFAVVLVDAFGVAVADVVFVAVFVGVAAGLDFSVRVGAAVALADVVAELEALVVALGLVVGDALVVVGVGVPDGVVGVAAGLVGVALVVVGSELGVGVCVVGAGEVGDGEGDGLVGAAGSCSGSQDLLLAVEAVLAAAVLAATVRLAPEAASRTLPAISVTVAGRACAKRMKRPISAASCGMPPTGHQVPRRHHPVPIPG
jgi:hypothetical protein